MLRSFALGAAAASAVAAADLKLIVDTDAGFDVDDVGALAVAHYLEQQGHCDIIGTIYCTGFSKGPVIVNTINNYWRGPGKASDIQLGAYKGVFGSDQNAFNAQNNYASDLQSTYPKLNPNSVNSHDDVPEAVEAYYKALSRDDVPDKSVVIASIGFPLNIRNLMYNETVAELFGKKVKKVLYMNEFYNFGCAQGFYLGSTNDCFGGAQKVVTEQMPALNKKLKAMGVAPVEQYFNPNGGDVCIGQKFFDNPADHDQCYQGNDNAVRMAYRDWLTRTKVGNCRSSWDPLTVYASVMGLDAAWLKATPGTDNIDGPGHENFNSKSRGDGTDADQHGFWLNYNTSNTDQAKGALADVMNGIICTQPKWIGERETSKKSGSGEADVGAHEMPDTLFV